jgi:hypothetical protein
VQTDRLARARKDWYHNFTSPQKKIKTVMSEKEIAFNAQKIISELRRLRRSEGRNCGGLVTGTLPNEAPLL